MFKSAAVGSPNIYQITGDVGTTNLSLQALHCNVSTVAANSIIGTPNGLFFVAPDGLRYVDTQGHVQAPIGYSGTGKVTPFLNASPQSRISGACNASVLAFGLYNSVTAQIELWCYDLVRQAWHGPHTFPAGLINSLGNSFLMSPYVASGQTGLYNVSMVPTSTSTYTEFGNPMACVALSTLLPERKEIAELSTVRSVMYAGIPAAGTTYNIAVQDVNANVLGSTSITTSTTPTTIAPFDVTWATPIVFDRAAVNISVPAQAGVRLNAFHLPAALTDYTVRAPGN